MKHSAGQLYYKIAKQFIEKPMLLNFVDLSTIFHLRLSESTIFRLRLSEETNFHLQISRKSHGIYTVFKLIFRVSEFPQRPKFDNFKKRYSVVWQ